MAHTGRCDGLYRELEDIARQRAQVVEDVELIADLEASIRTLNDELRVEAKTCTGCAEDRAANLFDDMRHRGSGDGSYPLDLHGI